MLRRSEWDIAVVAEIMWLETVSPDVVLESRLLTFLELFKEASESRLVCFREACLYRGSRSLCKDTCISENTIQVLESEKLALEDATVTQICLQDFDVYVHLDVHRKSKFA